MNIENAKSQMRKGMLEYCILLLLERQPAYSSDIIRSLKEAELLVVEGTLYPLLNRLKREGLLQYRWEESRMGPPRKYYALTDVGLQMLRDLDKAWAEISNTVNYLKNHNQQHCNHEKEHYHQYAGPTLRHRRGRLQPAETI